MTTTQDSASSKTFPVHNPATSEMISQVPNMGAREAELAIKKAKEALTNWKAKTGKERSAVLRRWFELISQQSNRLAELMTQEQGKPLSEARGEVFYGASFIEWFAEEAKRV
ncbi:MAG: hypothetical protein RL212_210, partial [Pseudomonadota bacterium]